MHWDGGAEMNRAGPQVIPLHGKPGQNRHPARATWLGYAAAMLSRLPRRRRSVTATALRREDYPTSTQRLGVSFSEVIRDTFRFRWVRRTR